MVLNYKSKIPLTIQDLPECEDKTIILNNKYKQNCSFCTNGWWYEDDNKYVFRKKIKIDNIKKNKIEKFVELLTLKNCGQNCIPCFICNHDSEDFWKEYSNIYYCWEYDLLQKYQEFLKWDKIEEFNGDIYYKNRETGKTTIWKPTLNGNMKSPKNLDWKLKYSTMGLGYWEQISTGKTSIFKPRNDGTINLIF